MILGASGDTWTVILEILPLQKSKEKPGRNIEKLRRTKEKRMLPSPFDLQGPGDQRGKVTCVFLQFFLAFQCFFQVFLWIFAGGGFPKLPSKYPQKPLKSFPCRFSLCQPPSGLILSLNLPFQVFLVKHLLRHISQAASKQEQAKHPTSHEWHKILKM